MVKKNGPLIVIRVTLDELRQLNSEAAAKRLSLNQYARLRLGLALEDKSPSVQRLSRRPRPTPAPAETARPATTAAAPPAASGR